MQSGESVAGESVGAGVANQSDDVPSSICQTGGLKTSEENTTVEPNKSN